MGGQGILAPMTAHVRASSALKRRLGILHGTDVARFVPLIKVLRQDLVVEALAGIIDDGMRAHRNVDGRIDMKDLSAYVLGRLRQKSDVFKAHDVLARLLHEAFQKSVDGNAGNLDPNDIAAHVIAEIRRNQR